MKDFLGNKLQVGDEVVAHDPVDGCYTLRRVICKKGADKVLCTGYYAEDTDYTETFNESELIKVIRE